MSQPPTLPPAPAEPRGQRRRSNVIVIAILLVALVAVVIIASAAFVDTADTAVVPQPDATTQHPIPAANPVPVPKPKDEPPKQRPEVQADCSENAHAKGRGLE